MTDPIETQVGRWITEAVPDRRFETAMDPVARCG